MMAWGFRPYVSAARRREQSRRKMDKLRKDGVNVLAVEIEGRKIAHTFWGQSWCHHLESFSDYANRLPRGRTYVRNGSVCHLEIAAGEIKAIVSGSELYNVKIAIKQLGQTKWRAVKARCAGQIGSLLELLQGRLSNSVMTVVTDRHEGLFPAPSEISLSCSCPDWAVMCKHVAAVLYGVGARLDKKPELLFLLRGVDHEELIEADAQAQAASVTGGKRGGRRIAESDLEELFGIEMLGAEVSRDAESRDAESRRSGVGSGVGSGSGSSGSRRSGSGSGVGSGSKETGAKRASSMGPGAKKATSVEPAAKNASNKEPVAKTATRVEPAAKRASSKEPGAKKANSKEPVAKTATRKEPAAKNASSKESVAKKASGSNNLSPTGKTVRELRARLGMSQAQLSVLIGVSTATISAWEKQKGVLNLQPRTMSSLGAAGKLSKKQAWMRV